MKNLAIFLGVLFVLISCDNSNHHSNQQSWNQNNDNTSKGIHDYVSSMKNEVNNTTNIPYGYTSVGYKEYVPKNNEERLFMKDLNALNNATLNLDYKKIVSMTYPDYFKIIQRQVPEKSISEIKSLYEKVLAGGLDERINKRTRIWPNTQKVGLIITNIINRVKERNGLLYLYEYHEVLFSENDTIYKKEAEYSIAASLNNGNKWYTGANSIEENWRRGKCPWIVPMQPNQIS